MTFKQRIIKWLSGDEVNHVPYQDRVTPTIAPKVLPPEDPTEPWVNIRSDSFDPVKGFKIELDWNDAFIQHLRDSGIKGRTDEEVVQKWIGMLYGDILQRMEQSVIENSDKIRINDFA